MKTVRDILRSKGFNVVTIQPQQTLREALQLLAQHRIGALMVTLGDNKPVGILSERDIIRVAAAQGAAAFDQAVESAMTKDLIIALPEDEITYLTHTMTERNIRHLPVLEDDKLIGILSIRDVVRALKMHYEGEIHTLRYHLQETAE